MILVRDLASNPSGSSRRGSVSLALVFIMMGLIGVAFQMLAAETMRQHRNESQHAQVHRLESAIETAAKCSWKAQVPLRLNVKTSPPIWITVRRIPSADALDLEFEATEWVSGQSRMKIRRKVLKD